jgi:hypothetical protein
MQQSIRCIGGWKLLQLAAVDGQRQQQALVVFHFYLHPLSMLTAAMAAAACKNQQDAFFGDSGSDRQRRQRSVVARNISVDG